MDTEDLRKKHAWLDWVFPGATMAEVEDIHRARAVELVGRMGCWGIDASKLPHSVGHIDIDLVAQALADAESRGYERGKAEGAAPWDSLVAYKADEAGNGASVMIHYEGTDFEFPVSVWFEHTADDDVIGNGKTATEAARDLCAKLGLEVKPHG